MRLWVKQALRVYNQWKLFAEIILMIMLNIVLGVLAIRHNPLLIPCLQFSEMGA